MNSPSEMLEELRDQLIRLPEQVAEMITIRNVFPEKTEIPEGEIATKVAEAVQMAEQQKMEPLQFDPLQQSQPQKQEYDYSSLGGPPTAQMQEFGQSDTPNVSYSSYEDSSSPRNDYDYSTQSLPSDGNSQTVELLQEMVGLLRSNQTPKRERDQRPMNDRGIIQWQGAWRGPSESFATGSPSMNLSSIAGIGSSSMRGYGSGQGSRYWQPDMDEEEPR